MPDIFGSKRGLWLHTKRDNMLEELFHQVLSLSPGVSLLMIVVYLIIPHHECENTSGPFRTKLLYTTII